MSEGIYLQGLGPLRDQFCLVYWAGQTVLMWAALGQGRFNSCHQDCRSVPKTGLQKPMSG